MNYDEIKKRLEKALESLSKTIPAFDVDSLDQYDDWFDYLTDPAYDGNKIPCGSFTNYRIFIENKVDGLYISLGVETEPLMVTNDWLFGGGLKPSLIDYDFDMSIFDVSVNYSNDDPTIVWEMKI